MITDIILLKEEIKRTIEKPTALLKDLTSEELFQVVAAFGQDPEIRPIIESNAHRILNRCSVDFDMYNYFTILSLKTQDIDKEECDRCLNITINEVFSMRSRIFLMKTFKSMRDTGVINKDVVFEVVLSNLKNTKNTDESSAILFDLYLFPDFKKFLNDKHRVISTLIESYQLYDPDVVSSQMFKGSSVIGKLLEGNNEEIVEHELRDLLEEKHISTRNIQMVGGGGSNLVYRIKNKVIKIGEERNNRRIYINHRILASLKRNLVKNDFGEDQFYVEVMKFVRTGDITPEERDELKRDLYNQGLVWTDDKLINCGLLDDDDENICMLPVDYIEVAGKIDNPYRREQFMKRKRKVVVIDNDHISYNPLKSSG